MMAWDGSEVVSVPEVSRTKPFIAHHSPKLNCSFPKGRGKQLWSEVDLYPLAGISITYRVVIRTHASNLKCEAC